MLGVSSSGKPHSKPGKHGGWRPNAGRKKSKELRFDPSHAKRPALSFNHPVHVMLRALPEVPRLRQRDGYEAIRKTLLNYLGGGSFRVVHRHGCEHVPGVQARRRVREHRLRS